MTKDLDNASGESTSAVAWQVEQLRFTGFVTSAFQVPQESFFKSVVGEEPATKVLERKKGISIEQGPFQDGTLGLQIQPRRIDWVLVQDAEKEVTTDGNSFDTVGPFAQLTEAFRQTMVKWLNHDLSLKRMAFGAVLLAPVESRQEGYQRLVPFLPNVKLDPINSSDFVYQINRPTVSKEMPKLGVNRLTKWGVIQLTRNQLAISVPQNQQAGPISGSWVPIAGPISACRLELDISTSGDFEDELPKAKLGLIFEELVEFGKEIAQKGDNV